MTAVPEAWERGERRAPPAATLPDMVLARARERPDALAVQQWERRLTYAELVAAAAGVANALAALGVGPEDRVGVCLRRRPALVAALLGAQLAGAAYVPLDPDLPARRLARLAADAGVAALVVDGGAREALAGLGRPVVEPGPDLAAAPRPCRAGPDNAAYVMYTSGSTGRPKGVVVTHRGVAALAEATAADLGLDASSRSLAYASIAFDVSVIDLLVPLTAGGAVMLVDDHDRADPARLQRFAERHRVTWMNPPVPLLPLLDPDRLPSLRTVTTGAEAPGPEQVERWTAGGRRFTNLYGPTETTVQVTGFDASGRWERPLPIGRPLANHAVHVVDAELRRVPAGAAGELLVGGAGLARGYLGRPDLTAASFLPDPFGAEPGARLYRTGDLAAWEPDGVLRFLGRRDRQVKIRGQRVEIGEVEAALSAHPGVGQAVVLAAPAPAGLELAAFVTPLEGPPETELRAWCAARLPAAMVPARVTRLARFPVLASGKVDTAALPIRGPSPPAGEEAEGRRGGSAVNHVVADAWTAVLGPPDDPDADFFASGGHSIAAMRLAAELRGRLARQVAVEDVFEGRTLAGIAARVEAAAPAEGADVPAGSPPALSAAQRRLWFVDRLAPGTAAYNIAMAERLRGPLDVERLAAALAAVAARHQVLRWRIVEAAGVPAAVADPPRPVPLPVEDLSGPPAGDRERAARELVEAEGRAGFDLAAGPLWRARLLRLAPDDHVLAITAHHAVFDGWSQDVLYRELGRAYAGDPPGEPPAAGFADYVAWREERARRRGAGDLGWWTEHLAGAPAVLDLPRDRPRPAAARHRAGAAAAGLTPAADAGVRALAGALGTTPSTVVMAAFAQLLHRVTGRRDLVIGTPVADRRHAAFQELVGFFVEIVPLRLRVDERATFAEHVLAARDELLRVLAHPEAPLERVVQALGIGRDPSRGPLVQVLFNVFNFAEPRLALAGVEGAPFPAGAPGSAFDLTVYLVERDGRFALDAVYDADLYDPGRAEALLAGCAGLVGALAAAPDAPAGAAGLVAADRLRAGLVDDRPPAPPRRPDPLDAPATPTERAVAEVWRQVLGTPAFGAGDNFFEVGGSSLAIVAVQVRLSERLGRQLRLVDLFRFPNVRGLAAHLDGARDDQMLERAARRVAVRRERLRQRPMRRAGADEEGGE